jgi:hypothetical protein
MNTNEPQSLRDEYFQATKILDAEYKPTSFDDVICARNGKRCVSILSFAMDI